MRQIPLLKLKKYPHRKCARPIATRGAMHVVMKARIGILRRNHLVVKNLIQETEGRFGIHVRELAIMDNHIHFLLSTPTRTAFQNALRFLAGQIAQKVTRGKLWIQRTWSRLVKFGRDYTYTRSYILANPIIAGIWDQTDFTGFG